MGFGSRSGFPITIRVPASGPGIDEPVDNPSLSAAAGQALTEGVDNPTLAYEITALP